MMAGVGSFGVGFGAGEGFSGLGLMPAVDPESTVMPAVPAFRKHPLLFWVNAPQLGNFAQCAQHSAALHRAKDFSEGELMV
jgi:hypothetical protein